MKRNNLLSASVVALVFLAMTITPLQAQNGNVWNVSYFANPDWAGAAGHGHAELVHRLQLGHGAARPRHAGDQLDGDHDEFGLLLLLRHLHLPGAGGRRDLRADRRRDLHQHHRRRHVGQDGAGRRTAQRRARTTSSVQYRQYTGVAYVYLNWAYVNPGRRLHLHPAACPHAGGTPAPPPPRPTPTPACDPAWSCSCPMQATSVTTQYGDYTPCIQQDLHQAACFQSNGAVGRAQHGVDPVRAADRGVGQLHAGHVAVHAAHLRPGAGGGHLLQDRRRLVLLRSLPDAVSVGDSTQMTGAFKVLQSCWRCRSFCFPCALIG